MVIMALKARLAAEGSGWLIAFNKATGAICQDTPHLSLHQHGKTIQPIFIYVVFAMAVAVFLLLQGVAWWHFWNPNIYSFRVTDNSVEYKTKNEGYKLDLSSIQRIETSLTHGGETPTIDYFFVTDSGENFKIPKIHNLPDGKIVKAIMTANPAIIKK